VCESSTTDGYPEKEERYLVNQVIIVVVIVVIARCHHCSMHKVHVVLTVQWQLTTSNFYLGVMITIVNLRKALQANGQSCTAQSVSTVQSSAMTSTTNMLMHS
jgi:hypothetical protein